MIEALRRLLQRPAREEPAGPDWKAQGNDFLAQGHLAEAERCYRAAVAADAQDAAARVNLGFVLLERQLPADAMQWLREALRLQPGLHDAHFLLARAARAEGSLEAAAQAYAEAVRHEPGFDFARSEGCEVCIALGRREEQAGRLDEARRWFEDALQRQPGDVEALMGMGRVALHRKDHATALRCAEQVLAANPDDPVALVILGMALQPLGRIEEALQGFRRALELRPAFVEALVNMGGALMAQNRLPEAVEAFGEALQHDAASGAAHWNRSQCLLLLGRLEAAWPEAEWRWEALGFQRLATDRPQWTGVQPLAGKTVLVHAEQGLGDTLQFCRYVPLLAQRGATVLLTVQKPLEGVVQSLAGPFRLLRTGERIPAYDYHCPLLSLPLAFGTQIATIPAAVPYLAARPERVARWRERLPASGAVRVGIVWSGNPTHVNDRNRSMPLERLLQIGMEGVQLVSLQKEVRPADAATLRASPVVDFADRLEDFEDTAALVECMDLIISVDTSVAHLAGALGKPLWILLPFSPDWRWMLERQDSPWYPGARLFRQAWAGDWAPVLERVREELAHRVRG